MDNKSLIDKLSRESGIEKGDVQAVLNDMYAVMARCMLDNDTVIVSGFGAFEAKRRKERLTVHPSTGKRLMVPPKLIMAFRASGILKGGIESNQTAGSIDTQEDEQ